MRTALLLLDFSAAFDFIDHDLLTLVLKTCSGITTSQHQHSTGSNHFSQAEPTSSESATTHQNYSTSSSVYHRVKSWVNFFSFYTRPTLPASRHYMTSWCIFMQTTLNCTYLLPRETYIKQKINLSPVYAKFGTGVPQCVLISIQLKRIWFHRNNHQSHHLNYQCLQLDPNCAITPVNTVRDLGVLLDSSLNLRAHITSVTRSCFFHLRRKRKVRKCLSPGSSSRYIKD